MSRFLARLALVLFALVASVQAGFSKAVQTGPSVKVSIAESPGSVTTGDPIKGSVVITLAGFTRPVNVVVMGGLSDKLGDKWSDVPRAIVLHSRPNGSYRLSFSGDLDLRATCNSVPDEVLVSATVVSGGRSIAGKDRKPIEVLDAKEDVFFAELSLAGSMGRYTFPLNVPTKVTLNYSVFSQKGAPISGAVKESVRILGPAEQTYAPKSRQLDRASQGFQIRSPYDFTFTRPGEYRVEYELSIEGGKPLRGREILHVPGPVEVTLDHAAPGLGSDLKAAAGLPFNFLVKFRANKVTENQFEVVESLEFVGPETVAIKPKRLLEGPGDLSWESLYEVKLARPGIYHWKVVLLPSIGPKTEPMTGTVTVTSPVAGAGGKVWTRGEAVNDVQYLQDLKLGSSSVSWTAPGRDGKSGTSTLSWTEPPTTLTEGQSVNLKLSFTPWTGPAFEARIFSYAFDGGRNNMLTATANNPSRLTGERTFTFQAPQGGEPQDQATVVLQVNYRTGDLSQLPTNRLYRSWIYRKGGVADSGAAGIKDKTVPSAVPSPRSEAPRVVGSSGSPNSGSLSRSSVTQSVGGLKIGIKEGVFVVTEVILQTGADIKPGDQILEINGKATTGLSMDEVAVLLNDPGTTQTTLKIKRADGMVVTMVTGKRSG